MCAALFHQWLHEYCPLKRQLPLACRRNTYLWRHPTNNSPTVSNRSSEVAKRHQLCGSESFWMRRLFNVCVLDFCVPNVTILLVYIPAKIKMSFIWKDNILLRSASSVSRSQAHFSAFVKRIHNHIRAAEV